MISSLLVRIREEGICQAAIDVGKTLVPTRFEVWERSTQPPLSRPTGSFELLTGDRALSALVRLREGRRDLPVAFLRDRIDGAGACTVALADGKLAGIAWAYGYLQPGHFLRLRPHDFEIRSIYALDEFRGRGIGKALVTEAARNLEGNGCARIYAVIHYQNAPSQRAFAAAGFARVAQIQRPALFGPKYSRE